MEKIDPAFVAQYIDRRAPWGFSGLGEIVYMRTYSRFNEEQGRKEYWHETLERAINGAQEIGAGYTQEEMQRLFDYMFNLKGIFSGRALWQLGTPLVKKFNGASLINCYYTNIESIEDFEFLMDHLMLGGGVGFSIERALVHSFPKVKTGVSISHERTNDADFIVPDSRQGWSALLHKVLKSYFYTGKSFSYSTVLIRSFGAPLKTFGGTASGPEVLIEGIVEICKILEKRAGKKMRSIDALDIANVIGMIVVAGSARRSAQLSAGDPDDFLFLRAKNWGSGTIPAYRGNSNNSILADSYDEIVDELWKGYQGNGEPYGLLNRQLASTQGRLGEPIDDRKIMGYNPCVTGDTWVLTEVGPRQVINLLHQPIALYADGKPYLTRGFFETGIKEVYNLATKDGYSVQLTADHRVMTDRGWVEAKDLVEGDNIHLHQHENVEWFGGETNSVEGSFRDGYVLGHWLGDGTTYSDGSIRLQSWGNSLGERAVRAYLEEEGLTWRYASSSDSYCMQKKELTHFIGSFFDDKKSKNITDSMLKTSSSFQSGLLSALFDTDGHVEGQSTDGGISIRLSQSNLALLETVQRMLLNFGIRSKIRRLRPAGPRLMPDGHGGLAEYECRESWRLIITTDVATFMERIGFINTDKSEKATVRIGSMARGSYEKSWTTPFQSLEFLGEVPVYDVQVPGVNAFDANGLYVHNCAEIALEDGEVCNLADIFLPRVESEEELFDISRLLYKTQKAITSLHFPYEKTRKVVARNRRLGQGITGWMQATHEQLGWVSDCYEMLRDFDEVWSAELGVPASIKLTTTKPSGTLSLLPGVTPGIHPAYARYYIRRVRIGAGDPIIDYCRQRGYPVQFDIGLDGQENHRQVVVSFPCESPPNAILAKELSAVEQLDWVVKAQTLWADNAVSVTVYYHKDELPEIQKWLDTNYETKIKSVSFLLHSEHGFILPPYEEISEEEYNRTCRKLKDIAFQQLAASNDGVIDDLVQCDSGACPIR